MTDLMEAGAVEEGGIIRAMEYVCNDVPDNGQTLCVHSEFCSLFSTSAHPYAALMKLTASRPL